MKLRYEFDHVNSNGDIKEKITKKFSALEKYLVRVREDFHQGLVRIIKGERFGYRVRVDVNLPGKKVVAEGKAETLLDAVDLAYHKTARIIREYLERLKEKKR